MQLRATDIGITEVYGPDQLVESVVAVTTADTLPTPGQIFVSRDLVDAERVLHVQEALVNGFETEPEPTLEVAVEPASPIEAVHVPARRHMRKRTARYRMPRVAKRKLLDAFCGIERTDMAPRTLMIVAHPDDESIGAGSRLAELSEAWVTYVTDGAPRDPAVARRYGFDTREAYAERRRHEAMAALSLAGVPEAHIGCLGIVDGEASLHLVDMCLRIAELLDTLRPNVVLTHPYEGGHTDHDATAFAVHLACGILRREGVKPPAVFEITSYNAANGDRVVQQFLPHRRADLDGRMLRLEGSQEELKRKMFECFETQQKVLSTFDPGVEKFRPAPRYVFTRPPHAGVLNYERYGDPDLGRRFREGAEEALRELRLRRNV